MARTVYTLEVTLLSGCGWLFSTDEDNHASRIIEIRGDQTLQYLHRAIEDAFDRTNGDHMYEFQMASSPEHRRDKARPKIRPFSGDRRTVEMDLDVAIDRLGLEVRDRFWYCYDFGDCWKHKIVVKAVGEADPSIKYPRITERRGRSPVQYGAWDDPYGDDEEDEDEEDGEEVTQDDGA